MHVRRQIREAVETALAGLSFPITEQRQSSQRITSGATFGRVVVPGETVDPQTVSGAQQRAVQVTVVLTTAAGSDALDTLDAASVEVENAMANAGRLGGLLARSIRYAGMQIDGEAVAAGDAYRMALQYEAQTRTTGPESVLS